MSIVETQYGRVESVRANGLHAFLAVPFAAPPVGELRWRPPADPTPWTGVRRAADFSAQSWQSVLESMGPLQFAFNSDAGDPHERPIAESGTSRSLGTGFASGPRPRPPPM